MYKFLKSRITECASNTNFNDCINCICTTVLIRKEMNTNMFDLCNNKKQHIAVKP